MQSANDDMEFRTKLIVNYLPQSMSDAEFMSLFVPVGPVATAKVARDLKTGYSFGYGFVTYEQPDDAERAIQRLNGITMQNKRLKVSYSRPNTAEIRDTNLYISGLGSDITEDALQQLFGQFGTIINKNILLDKGTGVPKGVAFVRFDRKNEASNAITHLNGYEWNGRQIQVKIAEEHGKAKAQYYAGYMSDRGGGRGRGHRKPYNNREGGGGGGGYHNNRGNGGNHHSNYYGSGGSSYAGGGGGRGQRYNPMSGGGRGGYRGGRGGGNNHSSSHYSGGGAGYQETYYY